VAATSPVLLTGASGYVGGRLAPVLIERGHRLRCLMRAPDPAQVPSAAEIVRGDVLSGEGLAEALDGVALAYYLIHSMGRGRAARAAGVRRVVYLGGLPSNNDDSSHHLDSRHETAETLRDLVPELVHARAAMVLGGRSASFEMLHALVTRLPVMITPRWIDVRSQPIAIDDVVRALAELGERDEPLDEVQLGGNEVLTYREMMLRFAEVIGRRPPTIVKVPILSPRLSSYWVGLVTPVETGLVRPLVDGLRSEMIVQTPPPCGINDSPLGFADGVRAALAEASSTG
jgi:uncharacterized protein YbjT (DUF2867 family)